MRVLVACEESQAVTVAFRALGHEAYSCDVQPCSGGFPQWHILGDVNRVLAQEWDLIIAHPPCTYLTNTGVRWLTGRNKKPERWGQLWGAAQFFKIFLDHPCARIAIENPVMHKYAINLIGGKKHDQIVQPYEYGHAESKKTALWLKGLPPLRGTNNVKEEMMKLPKNQQQRLHYLGPSPDRAKLRSKTYTGIAFAMAQQWGCL